MHGGEKPREDGAEDDGVDTPLYSEDEVATVSLRFSHGDEVFCNVGCGKAAPGIVVRRFYREEGFPRGHYAAVCTLLCHRTWFICSIVH